MGIEERLRAAGGAARTREITRTSQDRVRIAAAVEAGTVVRVARGIVALPGAEDLGVALACGGALTCVSVLAAARLPLRDPPTALHVAVPPSRGSRPGVVQHWSDTAPRGLRASIPLALAHAYRCLPVADWIAALDAAVLAGVHPADIRRHAPTRALLGFEAGLRAVDPRCQSLPESLLRVALRGAGLRANPQVSIAGVGRVDFLVERVIVEVDGFAYHSGRQQYREDRRRDRAAHAAGYAVLRFTFEEVMRDLGRVVAEVAEAVRASSGRA